MRERMQRTLGDTSRKESKKFLPSFLNPFSLCASRVKSLAGGAAWRQRCDSCDSGSNAAVTAACTVQCTPGFLAKAFSWTQRKWDKKSKGKQCSCESNSISAATEPCTVMYPQLFGWFKIFTFLEHLLGALCTHKTLKVKSKVNFFGQGPRQQQQGKMTITMKSSLGQSMNSHCLLALPPDLAKKKYLKNSQKNSKHQHCKHEDFPQ